MLRFALRNLVRNRARTTLALLGLAASTAGVVLLVSLSFGARRMVGEAMDLAKGVIVLKKHAPDPLMSRIPADLEARLAPIAGISAIVPEVWQLAFSLEEKASLSRGMMNMTALMGVDPVKREKLRQGGLFARSIYEGRPFRADELDGALISKRLAKEFGKEPGSPLKVMERDFVVTGLFETGTPVFDNVIVAHESRVREISGIPSSSVSCLYLEVEKGESVDAVASRVTAAAPTTVEVKSTTQWGKEVGALIGDLDPYLATMALVAGVIGAIGVVNTMLMSVRERVRELGVLRATGWTRGDAFRLILVEATLLGAVGGAAGSVFGAAGAIGAARFLPIKPDAPPSLVLASTGFAIVLGALGGLYPAVYASRLDPIGAIRGGGG